MWVGFAQTDHFEKGKVLNSVSVPNSVETYALYLPKTYDKTKLSAVVFVFDPSGNGMQAIQSFTAVAEKFNYIIIASNNTKNGVPYETNFEIVNRLFETVFSTFSIDEKQIYTAGFSGGSRLATAIAALTGKIQGVVACGAGLSINESFTPTTEMFSFVGLVGDEDMNYQEMFTTKNKLDKFEVSNQLFVYNDSHRWSPKEQLARAFGWLELRAYEKKIRPIDSLFVKKYYQSEYVITDSLANHHYTFRAVLEYESMLKNFQAYYTLDSIETKIKMIKSSAEYQREVTARATNIKQENDLYEKFSKVYSKDILKASSDDNFQWWRREIKLLDANIANAETVSEAKMLKRLKGMLFAGTFESSMSYVNAEKFQLALYCDQLLVYLNPDQAYWYYRVAQSYARTDNFQRTIKNLKKAKELGLQRFEAIEDVALFAKFKQKKKFKKLFKEDSK